LKAHALLFGFPGRKQRYLGRFVYGLPGSPTPRYEHVALYDPDKDTWTRISTDPIGESTHTPPVARSMPRVLFETQPHFEEFVERAPCRGDFAFCAGTIVRAVPT
jgi:hypothetical protein